MAATQQGRTMQISTPLGEDFLLINKLSATEGLSELFRFDVELFHEEEEGDELTIVDIQEILGQPVVIKLTQRDQNETTRYFHGIVSNFSQGGRSEEFTVYYATIVPSVWLLTQNYQSRIFQHKDVIEILKEVFAQFPDIEWKHQGTYNPRNYCVQYRESDFAFASRLMEEEGIFYFFEHTEENHKMIIADTPQQHLDCPSKHEIPFTLEVTRDQEDWVSSIGTWRADYKLQSGKVTLWDYKFELPKTKLDAEQPALVSVGGNQDLEIYDYPGGYARKYDGIDKGGGDQANALQKVYDDRNQTVKTRMQELDAQYKTFSGISDCCSLTAGYRFKMSSHPNKDFNTQYTLVSVRHEVEQTPEYSSENEVPNSYGNNFTCIMHGGTNPPFRPPQKTPKPIIQGSQTAFVVGLPGEEIFTDKYGRVKVQFHWDREGQLDNNSSCWVRVIQAWAGNKWGMMFIPRIGMEVKVDFLEGDPDQPIITGCVYNAQAMPPYELPNEKTKMTIKSDSSMGGQGFNELRLEDKKGSEQVFIHGEKDIDIRNKNDRREYVGNDHHFIVKNDRREKIQGNEYRILEGEQREKISSDRHLKIEGEDRIAITGTRSLEVSGDVNEKCSNHSEQIGQTLYLKAGMTVVIEAGVQLTLKAGSSFVDIGPAGVTITGSPLVLINSGGAAGSASATAPVAPQDPKVADPADDAKPGTKIELEKRSAARKEKKHKEDKKKKSWIEIKMVDEEGKPVPGISYKVTTPEGRVKSGTLNKDGKAHVKGFDPGTCKVTFPDLDQEAWEDA